MNRRGGMMPRGDATADFKGNMNRESVIDCVCFMVKRMENMFSIFSPPMRRLRGCY